MLIVDHHENGQYQDDVDAALLPSSAEAIFASSSAAALAASSNL
jgi:hypothetical protein